MSRGKKIVLWVMGIIGALLALLLIIMLLLPKVINLEPIRQKIVARISEEVGGELEYQRAHLSFFPRPRVIIHQGSLSIPGKVAGSLASLKIYPEILPLLRGRVRMAMLHLEAPDLKMKFPKRPEEKAEKPRSFSVTTIGEELAPVLALMALRAPGLILVVDQGRLDLTEGNTSVFRFRDIHGRIGLPPERLEIDLTCNSNLWESISLEGWLNTEDFKGDGHIHVIRFQPQKLTDRFFPLAAGRVGDSEVNLDLSFKTDGLNSLQGTVRGSVPFLTLRQEKEKLVIKGKSLKGSFHLHEGGITASLAELDLDYPQLRMSGNFRMDRTTPRVNLELEGREVDVHSIREAALALAGEMPIIRELFGFVRRGKVPLITINAQGSSLADLEKLENIHIKGSMVEGEVFVPGANVGWEGLDLELEGVKGEMVISGGILEGKNLEARWKNAQGREGIVKLGLEGDDAPFHLNIRVQVDLAQLPTVLERLVQEKSFLKEIGLIGDLRGTATGRLVLSGSTAAIKPYVDVSEFSLSANYGRVPYGIQIKGGHFTFSETTISVENIDTTVGKSSMSGVSGRIDWEKTPYFEVKIDESTYIADEIYPLLASFEELKPSLEDFKAVRGVVIFRNSHVKGPLLEFDRWQFKVAGEVREPVLITTKLLGPIEIARGKFESTEDAIRQEASFQDAQLTILDASLVMSGTLKDYLAGISRADMSFQGDMGAESMRRLSELIHIPEALNVRAPLSISKGRLVWDRGGQTSFSGEMVVQEGPRISMDISLHPGDLLIKNLLIQDQGRESRFAFELNFQRRAFNLEFMGHLTEATIERLLDKNPFPGAWIKGNFRARILMDEPARSFVEGKLSAEEIVFPLAFKKPLIIDTIALEAAGNRVKIESAVCTWGDRRIGVRGDVSLSPAGFFLDVDVSTDNVNWDDINDFLGKDKQEKDQKEIGASWDLPVQGILRLTLETFSYERFTWSPFRADISLSRDRVDVTVNEANLCGISTTGTLKVSPREVRFHVDPISKNQELDPTLACLWDKQGFISGNFDLKGSITGRGGNEELTRSLRGNFALSARDGRIYRSRLLSIIFSLINTTEIFRGKFPDLGREGFAYNSIDVRGNVKEGKLTIEEAILDGSSMEIVGKGDIDLVAEKIDLTLLVAPLKTVDFLVRRIPLVRDILGGTLISMPVRVTGDLANPTVKPLAPSVAGSELTGIMRKTFRLPVKVIQPLRLGKGEE
jgi:hypothetical protein